MSNNELTAKIHELRELQALIEEAEQEADTIRDAIKAHMGKAQYTPSHPALVPSYFSPRLHAAGIPELTQKRSPPKSYCFCLIVCIMKA